MAKLTTTTTKTVCTCDRCGYVQDKDAEFAKGVDGEMSLSYKGDIGSKTWQGDWGGQSWEGDAWLCYQCSAEFIKFLEAKSKETP